MCKTVKAKSKYFRVSLEEDSHAMTCFASKEKGVTD